MHEIGNRIELEGCAVPSCMSARRRRLAAAIAAATAALALAAVSPVAAGGSVLGTGGALEITQLLNHAELIKEVAQQAQMISNQIKQYSTMIQNLKQLPESWVGEVTMPYRDELRTSIQRQHSLTMKQKRDEERSIELQTQRNMRALQELEARRRRDARFTDVPFKYPEWK